MLGSLASLAVGMAEARYLKLVGRVVALEISVQRATEERGPTAALEARQIVEDAVRRARRKAAIIQHKDVALLMQAIEQAEGEIATLRDVTAANAVLMSEVRHGASPQLPPESSILTQEGGDRAYLADSVEATSMTGSETAALGDYPSPSEAVAAMREFAAEIATEVDEGFEEFKRQLGQEPRGCQWDGAGFRGIS